MREPPPVRGCRAAIRAALLAAVAFATAYGPAPADASHEVVPRVEPSLGSAHGYASVVDERITPHDRIWFALSGIVGARRVRQHVVPRASSKGYVTVALRGLRTGDTYDVVYTTDHAGTIVVPQAFTAGDPHLSATPVAGDARHGPGEVVDLQVESPPRTMRVTVGGRHARVLSGPWRLDRETGADPTFGLRVLVPRVQPGTRPVVLHGARGFRLDAGEIVVLRRPRAVTFDADGRSFRSTFQTGVASASGFGIDGSREFVRRTVMNFSFTAPANVSPDALPVTVTDDTPGASLHIGFRGLDGVWHDWSHGRWKLTVERIHGNELVGSFHGDLRSGPGRTLHMPVSGGRFRVALESGSVPKR